MTIRGALFAIIVVAVLGYMFMHPTHCTEYSFSSVSCP
jgi:hypothetical protein